MLSSHSSHLPPPSLPTHLQQGAAEGDLSDVFGKVCGFFIHYADEKVPDTVANWNVKRLGLHRENRHLDMTALIDFYRHLDNFLLARKSTLAF